LQQPPALLVLEVDLPEGSGFEVVGALRRHPGLDATPLLVYTGLDLTAEQRRRLRLGSTRFLAKSATSDAEFRDAVAVLLQETTPSAAA
jgi:CheY-like chemotaxis protein